MVRSSRNASGTLTHVHRCRGTLNPARFVLSESVAAARACWRAVIGATGKGLGTSSVDRQQDEPSLTSNACELTRGAVRQKGWLPGTATRSRPRGAAPFSCRQRLRARGLLGRPPGHNAASLTTSACHLHGTRVRTGASAWAGHQSRMAVGAHARQRPNQACTCITGERDQSRHQRAVRQRLYTVRWQLNLEAGPARATWQPARRGDRAVSSARLNIAHARRRSKPQCSVLTMLVLVRALRLAMASNLAAQEGPSARHGCAISECASLAPRTHVSMTVPTSRSAWSVTTPARGGPECVERLHLVRGLPHGGVVRQRQAKESLARVVLRRGLLRRAQAALQLLQLAAVPLHLHTPLPIGLLHTQAPLRTFILHVRWSRAVLRRCQKQVSVRTRTADTHRARTPCRGP